MTFDERISMCLEVRDYDGCELADAIGSLCCAASILDGFSDEANVERCLNIAEDLCKGCMRYLQEEEPDWWEYEKWPAELFPHFINEPKLTEQQFNKRGE